MKGQDSRYQQPPQVLGCCIIGVANLQHLQPSPGGATSSVRAQGAKRQRGRREDQDPAQMPRAPPGGKDMHFSLTAAAAMA